MSACATLAIVAMVSAAAIACIECRRQQHDRTHRGGQRKRCHCHYSNIVRRGAYDIDQRVRSCSVDWQQREHDSDDCRGQCRSKNRKRVSVPAYLCSVCFTCSGAEAVQSVSMVFFDKHGAHIPVRLRTLYLGHDHKRKA